MMKVLLVLAGVALFLALLVLGLRRWVGKLYDTGFDDGKMMADLVGQLTEEDKAALVAETMARHPAGKSLQPCRLYDPPGLWCAPCRAGHIADCTDKR